MINSLAEGEAFHSINVFIQNYEKYKYKFIKENPKLDCCFLSVLLSMRYSQSKVKSDNKVELYPKQLITLAQYYYYHYPESKSDRQKTRFLLFKWITDFYMMIKKYYPEVRTNKLNALMNPAFSVPLFDNLIPFEAIINEAILAGKLSTGEYPSPEGLPLSDGTTYTMGECDEEGRKEKIKNFWLTQLNAINDTETKIITDREVRKEKKSHKDYSTEKLKEYRNERKTALNSAKRRTRRVDAVFLLALWYAQEHNKHNARIISMGKNPSDSGIYESRYFSFEVNRLKRVFIELSTNENYEKCFSDFKKFLSRVPAGELHTLGFTYKKPAKQPKFTINELPEISELDNGYRLRDTTKTFFYSISISGIRCISDEITELKNILEIKSSGFDEKNTSGEQCYKFDFKRENDRQKQREILENVLEDKLPIVADYIKKRIRKTHEFICGSNKAYDKINIYFSALQNNTECGLNDTEYKTLSDMLKNNIISKKDGSVSNHALNFAEKICLTDSENTKKLNGKELSSVMTKLVTNIWKSSIKTSNPSATAEKNFMLSLPEQIYVFLLTSRDYYDAIDEIIARVRTMILLMYKNTENSMEKYLLWYPAQHLCISHELLEQEKIFINKLSKNNEQYRI